MCTQRLRDLKELAHVILDWQIPLSQHRLEAQAGFSHRSLKAEFLLQETSSLALKDFN